MATPLPEPPGRPPGEPGDGDELAAIVTLDRDSDLPIYRQLDAQLRAAVLSGRLAPGRRLPSSRVLAKALGVSRLTVQTVFEQLIAEGYLKAEVGSGTFVAEIAAPPPAPAAPRLLPRGRTGSGEGPARGDAARAFRPGVPALDLFPMRLWSRLWSRHLKSAGPEMLGYGPPGGLPPLKRAIAGYLREARGVVCEPEQVIVVAGAQEAFCLAAWCLIEPEDAVWVEDPGHIAGRDALDGAGARIVPVPLDAAGLDIAAGRRRVARPKLVFVTPAHQHPLGVTMTLSRRLELLALAREAGAWILEDDYDSEFRYVGRPLSALQGLDQGGSVIYVGTFSKVLFPSLRLGYLVVPPELVEPFGSVHSLITLGTPSLPQAVLADFIAEGHFTAHIRRMRAANAERQALLLEALGSSLGDILETRPAESGLHLLGWLPEGSDDRAISRAAVRDGVEVLPLSHFCLESRQRPALLMGFACVPPADIGPGVEALARVLRRTIG